VGELLVVTFTRASAAEMRHRIEAALHRRAADGDRRLQRQIQLIANADISTLHSFCTRLLKRHFAAAGLDPSFTTLDEADALLLRNEVCRRLIANTYESSSGEALSQLVDCYCNGNDEELRRHILHIDNLRRSTVDPDAWSSAALNQINAAATLPLKEAELGRSLYTLLHFEIAALLRRALWVEGFVAAESDQYAAHVGGIRASLEGVKSLLSREGYEPFRVAFGAFVGAIPKLPTVKGGTDRAKKPIKALKDAIKGSLPATVMLFSEKDLQNSAAATSASVTLLLGLVESFSKQYADAKSAMRAVDFADLERLSLVVLSDPNDRNRPSPAALAYRAQFKHVLVDEYQDINALQDRLLRLVSRPADGTWGGNLFCVGDVKQSIYRFRLADPSQFLQRAQSYAQDTTDGQMLNLSRNFRSDPGVIHSINAVFKRLMAAEAAEIEYDDTHELRVGKPEPDWRNSGAAVSLHLLPDVRSTPAAGDAGDEGASDEAADTRLASFADADDDDNTEREAELAAQLIREFTSTTPFHRFEYGDIAILLRSRKVRAEKFANRLRQRGVPARADSTTGFFDAVEIRDMLSLLQCLDNTLQDIPLAAVLRSPLARMKCPEDVLLLIRRAYPSLAFHDAVTRYAAEQRSGLAESLRRFLRQLSTWRTEMSLRPVSNVLWQIFDETGFLAFCSCLPDGRQRVANLLSLHDRALTFSQFSRQGLLRFLEFLKALREESDIGLPPAGDEARNVVQIMSIHASKGLQFPVVIIPELGKKINLTDAAGAMLVDRERYIAMQVVDSSRRARWESIATMVARDSIKRKSLAEELRVLYVAMTRAEHKLVLTGTVRNPDEAVARWSDTWGSHHGAFPPDLILSARTALDWVGPAVAATGHGPGAIAVETYDADLRRQSPTGNTSSPAPTQLNSAPEGGHREGADNPRHRILPAVRELRAVPGQAPPSPATMAAIEALGWLPPTLHLSRVPSARAVTALAKSGRDAPAGESPSLRPIVKFTAPLPMPRFTTPGRKLSPTESGTITHRALQAIDLGTPPNVASVQAEIDRLIAMRVLSAEHAAMIDVAAIAWFLGTPLCMRMTNAGTSLFRELPVFAPEAAETETPLDRVMLRGQIDLLARVPEGLLIADYKTDRITLQTLPERAEFYRPQVRLYSEMIERITGLRVIEKSLIFLSVRQVVIA